MASAPITRLRNPAPSLSVWWAMLPFGFAVLACSAPWLLAHLPRTGLALQQGFAVVCHQQPERSFALFGGTIAVCARCFGIYLGAAFGLLLRIKTGIAQRIFLAALAVSAIDWLAEAAGLHGNWMLARLVLGCFLGAAGAMLVNFAASRHFESSRPGCGAPA